LIRASSEGAAMIGGRSASASSKPPHAASPPHTAGQITPRPAARAAIAAGSTPGTRLSEPSSASSPNTT
jgi:hypothetical protein